MPTNKKESIIFTLMMCTMMVLGMSMYNTYLHGGIEKVHFTEIMIGFVPAFVVALVLDVLVIGPLAKKAAFKLLGEHKGKMPLTALAVSCCMVCGMVVCMTLFGLVMQQNFSGNIFLNYLQSLGMNAVCAFPLQLVFVGPVSRYLLRNLVQ